MPKAGEVLIKVMASTVSVADHRMRARDLPKGLGFFGPLVLGVFAPRKKILGMDLAGVVEAVGAEVSRFKPGDAVVGLTGVQFGGHGEYVCLKQDAALVAKPAEMSFEDAVALVFGGHTVSECIRRCPIKPGDDGAGQRRLGRGGQRRGAGGQAFWRGGDGGDQRGQCRTGAQPRGGSGDRLHRDRFRGRRRTLRRDLRVRRQCAVRAGGRAR